MAIFGFALPRVADYGAVARTLADLTWLEFASLLWATALNVVTYWPVLMAAMPGLTVGRAAMVNQASTAVANTVPAGGAVAVGATYAMYRSWGFPHSAIALSALVTGVWNTFLKLGLPVVALAALAVSGDPGAGLLAAAAVGLAVLAGAVVVFALALWRAGVAAAVGRAAGRAVTWVRGLLGRPAVPGWDEAAVAFRRRTIDLVARRWPALTIATVTSHLALYVVLLLALRHVGVSEREVSWAEVLGVFAFVRLLSAVPVTPGGLGFVELGYMGSLVLAGRGEADVPLDAFRAQVVAAVLVFRALTWGLQIPVGALMYLLWRRTRPADGART